MCLGAWLLSRHVMVLTSVPVMQVSLNRFSFSFFLFLSFVTALLRYNSIYLYIYFVHVRYRSEWLWRTLHDDRL